MQKKRPKEKHNITCRRVSDSNAGKQSYATNQFRPLTWGLFARSRVIVSAQRPQKTSSKT